MRASVRGARTLALLLLALTAAASAAARPRALGRLVDGVRQLHADHGRLAWDGLSLGMTYDRVEHTLGMRLPPPAAPLPGDACARPRYAARLRGFDLELEFRGDGPDGRLAGLWVLLGRRGEPLDPIDLRQAVRARLKGLEHLPAGRPEELDPRPVYRLPGLEADDRVLLDPARGVYLGELCAR